MRSNAYSVRPLRPDGLEADATDEHQGGRYDENAGARTGGARADAVLPWPERERLGGWGIDGDTQRLAAGPS